MASDPGPADTFDDARRIWNRSRADLGAGQPGRMARVDFTRIVDLRSRDYFAAHALAHRAVGRADSALS